MASTSLPSPAKSSAKRKRRRSPSQENTFSDDSDVRAIKLEPKKSDNEDENPKRKRRVKNVVGSDSDDSEVEVVKRKTRSSAREKGRANEAKNKEKTKERKKKGTRKEDGEEKGPTKAKKKAKEPKQSDSDSEDLPQPPRRRKLVKGTRPAPRSDAEESDEVEPERIIESRFRSRNKKTEFQKNLERLKRKKQGKPMDDAEDEDEVEEEQETSPFKGAAPDSDHNSLFDGSESDGSESFIVEDDGTGAAVLPIEFSMDTHQDLSYHFKTIFQFFVHIAVHPPAERHAFMEQQMKNEEYFSVPLAVARRKILGLRDSLVASSVWRPEFKAPLEKYPELDLSQLDFAVPGCDACHLGARMSTLIGRLLGQPYDRLGYRDLDDDEGSVLDENGSRAEFHLGRFCARRTRVYHDLSHWEYMLFKTISDEVDDLHISEQEKGAGRFVKVAWAGGLKPPKDLQDADGICDWLDQRKIIEMEWEKLKGVMERARGLDLLAKRGDDVEVD
ncbi:hypothetical protein GYMLUDRAFT_45988 [Collybiopsis luxurians FD-317 M1]|uniref:DUF4211 domain-containing protein n=1 Tax=Collybiopsis luxurians FD-317 M1 TaxID=944289 RepID=A0A0D0BRF9_9AGAR|nr:hypothetical protein GYMLUDRAFT_45988 [Collybiopsis luxurians FD-317 M1]